MTLNLFQDKVPEVVRSTYRYRPVAEGWRWELVSSCCWPSPASPSALAITLSSCTERPVVGGGGASWWAAAADPARLRPQPWRRSQSILRQRAVAQGTLSSSIRSADRKDWSTKRHIFYHFCKFNLIIKVSVAEPRKPPPPPPRDPISAPWLRS